MEYSKYQVATFDWVEKVLGQFGAIDSVAGSGKTFSAVKCLEKASGNMLMVSFGKKIQEEMEKQTRHIMFLTVKTYNALGWSAFRRGSFINKTKHEKILRGILNPSGEKLSDNDFKIFCRISEPIRRLVSLGKGMMFTKTDDFMKEVPNLIDFHDIQVPEDDDKKVPYKKFLEILAQQYETSCWGRTFGYDYDDQIFQPLAGDWSMPKFDFIAVDEYQDTNAMQTMLCERCLKPGGRQMAFGDDDQCIYEFRGALPDTLKNWREKVNATHLPLSICYRCPVAVVEAAQAIVPRIEWAPGAQQGTVGDSSYGNYLSAVREGDYVICRTNAELVSDCLAFIGDGRSAIVHGKEVGDDLVAVVGRITQGNDFPIREFQVWMDTWATERRTKLESLGRDNQLERLNDKLKAVRACLDKVDDTAGLCRLLDKLFTDAPVRGIQLMSSHKSKGLQNPRVWVRCPEKLDDGWHVTRSWMRGTQRRLRYVTITRAQEELYWVETPKKQRDEDYDEEYNYISRNYDALAEQRDSAIEEEDDSCKPVPTFRPA